MRSLPDIQFPSLPSFAVGDETIFYEIALPGVDPATTSVTLEAVTPSASFPAELDFVTERDGAALYRGFLRLPNLEATAVSTERTVTIRVTVKSGDDTRQDEADLHVNPSRGGWVRTADQHYHPVTIFGDIFPGIRIESPFVSISAGTGLLWTQSGNRLVSITRSSGPTPSIDLVGSRLLGMVAGTKVVATIEITGHETSELIVYEPVTGEVRYRTVANHGPYFTRETGSETILFGKRSGGLTEIYSFKLGDDQPRKITVRPAPWPEIVMLPNRNLGMWLNTRVMMDAERNEPVSPPLVADVLSIDDLGLWLIRNKSVRDPRLVRYHWHPDEEFFHYGYEVPIGGAIQPISHDARLLASSRSCGLAFVVANRAPEGNVILMTPLGPRPLRFDKPVHSVYASATHQDHYFTAILWHRETIGPANGTARLRVVSQPNTGGVALHMNDGETLEAPTDDRGIARVEVPLESSPRLFLLTNGDDTNRALAYGHVAYPQRVPFGVGVAETLRWVTVGKGEITVGLARDKTLSVGLGVVNAPHQGAKLTGVLSSQGTLWTRAIPPLARLSYRDTSLSHPEAAVIRTAAPSGEIVWYLEPLDNTGKRCRLVRWDGERHRYGMEIEDAHGLAAIDEDRAIVIGRDKGPTRPMFAQVVTLDMVGRRTPVEDLFSFSAASNGPERIWLSGKNRAGRNVLVTLDDKGELEHGPILPDFEFDGDLLTGSGGVAWGYRPASGAEASRVLLWTDPRKPPLEAQHGGSAGVAIYAGPSQATVMTRTSRPGTRCREFRHENGTLRSLVDVSFMDDTFLWKELELD